MIRAIAPAKVNLSLEVGPVDAERMHPIRSLAVTVDWHDEVSMRPAPTRTLSVRGAAAAGAPDDESNLVWRAAELYGAGGLAIEIAKEIPAGAGLGGGSADAAATLRLLDTRYGTDRAGELAPRLGADVAFAVHGGCAELTGYGERIEARPLPADLWVALVVPPIVASTPVVYATWDAMGGPRGPVIDVGELPASLRHLGPLRNDLTPAAERAYPDIGSWRRRLETAWGKPVAMSGSGSALFSYCSSAVEAEEALAAVGGSVRRRVATAVPYGARVVEG